MIKAVSEDDFLGQLHTMTGIDSIDLSKLMSMDCSKEGQPIHFSVDYAAVKLLKLEEKKKAATKAAKKAKAKKEEVKKESKKSK